MPYFRAYDLKVAKHKIIVTFTTDAKYLNKTRYQQAHCMSDLIVSKENSGQNISEDSGCEQ